MGGTFRFVVLNGQTVNMAEFYETVAADVVGKINRDSLRHEWMASRYAYRARQAVEILDVVGEQTIRGEGPVAQLREKFQAQRLSLISPGRMVITSSSSMS